MNADPVIEAAHLSKRFRRNLTSLSAMLGHLLHISSKDDFLGLDDLTLRVEKGEAVGIIGKNGAGKSTLLKVLAGIVTPSKGTVKVRGKIGPLIELGAGFHPELTGEENMFLYGAILGMSRREIRAKFDTIASFAGIGDFLYTPVKFYSSGMYLRLAHGRAKKAR